MKPKDNVFLNNFCIFHQKVAEKTELHLDLQMVTTALSPGHEREECVSGTPVRGSARSSVCEGSGPETLQGPQRNNSFLSEVPAECGFPFSLLRHKWPSERDVLDQLVLVLSVASSTLHQ